MRRTHFGKLRLTSLRKLGRLAGSATGSVTPPPAPVTGFTFGGEAFTFGGEPFTFGGL